MLLKLRYDVPLSSFVFSFNLRRHISAFNRVKVMSALFRPGPADHERDRAFGRTRLKSLGAYVAGRCRLTLSDPR
jgi:hypothetical protein